jgi:hypothetical protein
MPFKPLELLQTLQMQRENVMSQKGSQTAREATKEIAARNGS